MSHQARRTTFLACCLAASADPKPGPDALIFIDGEKLIGHLESATSSSVMWKSDMDGEVTVDWNGVQELRSNQKFVAIPQNIKLRRREDTSKVPHGTVTAAGQKVEVNPGPGAAPQTIPTGNLADLVPETSFERAFQHYGFTQGWSGGAKAGISLTEATQKNQTLTGAVSLVRAVPTENWLDVRSRTIFNYNEAYGKLIQPRTPSIKTSLFHIDLEQDWYLSSKVFAFGQTVFDHSFSQGLELQQTYGGGVGIVVSKTTKDEFNFKASVDYNDQQFTDSGLDKKLFGSIFGEIYVRKFVHGITLHEQGGITPAWNNTSAYSAFASAGLTFPVYHHLGVTLRALDNFLNDPPPGVKLHICRQGI